MPRIEDIIVAAKERDFLYVNRRIPEVCDDVEVQKRALLMLQDPDSNVRYLGASILQIANIDQERFAAMRKLLLEVMLKDKDYTVRNQAAFVIADHAVGAYPYKNQVLKALRIASMDMDVGAMAKLYYEKLTGRKIK